MRAEDIVCGMVQRLQTFKNEFTRVFVQAHSLAFDLVMMT